MKVPVHHETCFGFHLVASATLSKLCAQQARGTVFNGGVMQVAEPRGAPLQSIAVLLFDEYDGIHEPAQSLDRLCLERIVKRLELLAATSQARRS